MAREKAAAEAAEATKIIREKETAEAAAAAAKLVAATAAANRLVDAITNKHAWQQMAEQNAAYWRSVRQQHTITKIPTTIINTTHNATTTPPA